MMTLADYLNEHEREFQEREAQREALRAEWVQAVERLLQQIEQWVREADPKGRIRIERTVQKDREQALGFFEVPRLILTYGTERVEVVAWARFVVGGIKRTADGAEERIQGSVHIANGSDKVSLYRLIGPPGDEWFVDNQSEPGTTRFTRECFDTLLLSLIK